MDNKTIKGQTYPGQIYLTFEKDGKPHFYSKDPMTTRNRSEVEIRLAESLAAFFGHCDIINPMIIKVAAVVNHRGDAFDISIPGKIRTGAINRHLEDMDGNIVEILQMRSPDPSYPLNGIVFSKDGKAVETRLYNGAGDCSDGDSYHRILVVNGPVEPSSESKPEDGTIEGAGNETPENEDPENV